MPGLFWSLVWTHFGQFFVVLSMAEMARLAPTVGGLHHRVSAFAPRGWEQLLSYCSGWLSTLGWQSVITVDCYIISCIIQALIGIRTPTYNPTRWAGTLFTMLAVLLVSAFNILVAGYLSFCEGVFATCHVFAFVPVVVTLWVLSSPKMSAAEIFVQFKDYTESWPSTGLSTLVGQVSCIFVTLGSDAVAHLCGDTESAAIVVPQGMVWSYVLNIPLTFIMLLAYLFNISSVEAALKSPLPFVYVLWQA